MPLLPAKSEDINTFNARSTINLEVRHTSRENPTFVTKTHFINGINKKSEQELL